MNEQGTAIVVGGGIIGCSVACELAERGVGVTLLDKGELNREATAAAGGMLGAHVESHHPGAFFELCKASLAMYSDWAERVCEVSRISPQYEAAGIVRAAFSAEDEAELRGRLPWIGGYTWLPPEDLRALEPAIGPDVRGGLYFADDHRVHPVHLARALEAAAGRLGVRIREWTPVLGLLTQGSRVTGIRTGEGELFADRVIVTSGAWSPQLLAAVGAALPMSPVKGQCYSLRPAAPVLTRTVYSPGCYLLPRLDGTVTIGATQIEVGFDKTATVTALAELHAKTSAVLPALRDAAFVATWAGLRPGTPDGLPYLGFLPGVDGLVIATGHFRNGILLAPLTGKLAAQLALGEEPAHDLAPYAPDRFPQPQKNPFSVA